MVSNAATTLVVSGITSPQVAGTTSSVRVEARDAAGNIARGYTGTVRISTTDGQATRPADHTFTTSDAGIYTFSGLILRTAATQSVTATDIATSSITGTQSGVVVTPGPAATLLVGGLVFLLWTWLTHQWPFGGAAVADEGPRVVAEQDR